MRLKQHHSVATTSPIQAAAETTLHTVIVSACDIHLLVAVRTPLRSQKKKNREKFSTFLLYSLRPFFIPLHIFPHFHFLSSLSLVHAVCYFFLYRPTHSLPFFYQSFILSPFGVYSFSFAPLCTENVCSHFHLLCF